MIMCDLKAEIARRGLKIKTVALSAGVDYGRLVRIMNGFVEMDSAVLNKVRSYLEKCEIPKVL